jgi:hypothetical protein
MDLHSWLAALFLVLTLGGCTQGVTGQAAAPNAPYSRDNNEISTAAGMAAVVEAAECRWRGTLLIRP